MCGRDEKCARSDAPHNTAIVGKGEGLEIEWTLFKKYDILSENKDGIGMEFL